MGGGVLFQPVYPKIVGNIHRFFEQLSEDEIEKIIYGKELGQDYRNGKYDKQEFWQKAKEIIGKTFDTELFAKKWHDSYVLNKEVLEIIKSLKKTYKIGVISGNIKERVDYLNNKYDILNYFDLQVFSFNVGKNKPNTEIYERFLKNARVKGDKCVFVDDEVKYLEAASRHGMRTILFQNVEQLRTELKRMNLIF